MINTRYLKPLLLNLFAFILLFGVFAFVTSNPALAQSDSSVKVNQSLMGFKIPNLGEVLTFLIRFFFVIAGLAALLYLLLGAFAWVTSGGDKDAVSGAQQKIQAAVIGVILIVAVLAVIVTLEQIVFQKKICFGLSCPATIPGLISACVPNPAFEINPDGAGVTECCPADKKVVAYDTEDNRDAGLKTGLTCCAADADGNNVCDQ